MSSAQFSQERHIEAVIRRRIKFVVEKGAMARLFKKNSHRQLQGVLRQEMDVDALKARQSADDFDAWHRRIVLQQCWANFTDRPIEEVRWGHFAKLINIILYELAANNEIVTDDEARRLRGLLHLPIDQKVLDLVRALQPGTRLPKKLLGMTEADYVAIQRAIRDEARRQ